VFFEPVDPGNTQRLALISKKFNLSDIERVTLINCEYFIRPLKRNVVNFVNKLDYDKYGYVMAWDGNEFVTQNT
jgi:hypothetical protein